MKRQNPTDLLIYIVSAEAAGALSALLSGGFKGIYSRYVMPPLLPPPWVFPVVWVILFAAMGTGAFLAGASEKDVKGVRKALAVYWTQLAVNFSYSIIFFRFEAFEAASAVVILLLVLIAVMIVLFSWLRPAAGYICIPYLLWVAFASYLTIAVALLN